MPWQLLLSPDELFFSQAASVWGGQTLLHTWVGCFYLPPHLVRNNQKNYKTYLLAICSRVTFAYPDINEISADQGRRREEKGNSLRPQGRPNPIIPITPLSHTLMMGIKMCWPRSTPTPQPDAAECVGSRAVADGKDDVKESVICAVQHSSMGVFGSALCSETGRCKSSSLPLHVLFFFFPVFSSLL